MGDVAHSRGIIQYLCQHIPEDIEIAFLSNLQKQPSLHIDDRVICQDASSERIGEFNHCKVEDKYYVNLWIASYSEFMNVERKNCTISNLSGLPVDYTSDHTFNHCKFIIDRMNEELHLNIPHPKEESDILPRSIKSPERKSEIEQFLNTIEKYRSKIFLCNSVTHSGQCSNFDVRNSIISLIGVKKDTAFIYTNNDHKLILEENEYCIDDIFPKSNLNQIEYLSQFCDVLVSRQSGPGCVIQTYENMHDPNKVYISLTSYDENAAFYYKGGACRYDRTTDHSPESISALLSKYI